MAAQTAHALPVDENAAIGIFDSGIGGLTVMRQVALQLPEESVVYLGDTARVPYGTKSADTVIRYAHNCSRVLLARDVKLIVVACNTASAYAVDSLAESLDVPVIGVVHPGARAAVRQTRNGRIGVIGTTGAMASGLYPRTIQMLLPEAQVFSQPCPLFVPLVEEGWTNGEVPRAVAERYLHELLEKGVDTLVLGCTHYPLLRETIAAVAGEAVALVDSAAETAAAVGETLDAMQLRCRVTLEPQYRYLVSDGPDGFAAVGRRFLGWEPDPIEWVDF